MRSTDHETGIRCQQRAEKPAPGETRSEVEPVKPPVNRHIDFHPAPPERLARSARNRSACEAQE